MAPPPMRTWLPWSELVKGPPVTVDGFRDILRKYPRSSILRACARLIVTKDDTFTSWNEPIAEHDMR
jgi:hypothetical protein